MNTKETEGNSGFDCEKVKFYGAPMEGVTGYTFRRVHDSCYPGVDKYFSPFLSPNQHHAVNPKEKRDILPEHNQGLVLVPQVLTNKPELMLAAAKELLEEYGYQEVNLNLGCPSKTVVSKHKGSGFLEDTEKLERFFEEVFTEIDRVPKGTYPDISVKTRLGLSDPEEFADVLNVYNKYPLSELIIHPRVQKEFYSGKPHLDAFAQAMEHCPHSLCYNGDIWTLEDYIRIKERFPTVKKFMLGRPLVANPELVQELQAYEKCLAKEAEWTGYTISGEQLKRFHDRLLQGYVQQMSGDENNVLFKMKELWGFLCRQFPDEEKQIKKLTKTRKLAEYESLAEAFLSQHNIQ